MKALALLAATLLLSGCGTVGQVMERTPSVTLASNEPAQDVVNCYAPKALSEWGQSKVVPNGSGQTIVVGASAWGEPVAVATIMPSNSGSSVIVRRGKMTSDRVFDSVVSTLRGCTAS